MLSRRRLSDPCVLLVLFCLVLAGGATTMSAAEKPSGPGFDPLPGKAVGVLVGDVTAAMARAGRSGPEDAVGFACGNGGYRWVYVPSPADSPDSQSLRLPVGKEGKEYKRFESVELLRRPLLKEKGLDQEFQLVEVEVNGGAGSPGCDTVVLTSIKPLDGTTDYPLRVAAAVSRLKKDFTTLLRDKAKEIETALAREQKKALGEKKPTGPRRKKQEVEVTWLPKDEVLKVEWSQQTTDGLYSTGKGIDKSRSIRPAPRGGPSRSSKGQRFGITFGVDARATWLITKTGERRAPTFAINPIRANVPPPPTAKPLPARSE
jgi:hypothetical protein